MNRRIIRSALLAASWCIATTAAADIQTSRLLVLDAERAGARLVAVGERGTVLLSDDQAQHWNVVSTGITRTLTAVAFVDAKVGVAVGHGGTLMRTADAGRTWTRVDVADAVADDSLLAVTALDAHRFVAVGAFGLYLESSDAGQTWERRSVLGEEGDAHLMGVFAEGARLFVVGEAGTLCRSDDQGHTWQILESPYAGSFFGGLFTQDGTV
ncbi:MAG: WD40/YVTN/BNR-like repeat-containing protein, partial [Panacagrimonas sp.]